MLKIFKILAVVLALGLCIPGRGAIPVQNATAQDWNTNSFWFAPWGKSGVHKGIGIFAPKGTRIISSTHGLVIFTGNIDMGGNVVAILGPKWCIHYYAHLDSINAKTLDFAGQGDIIGSVGVSGNAKNKPPHLHYSVMSLAPYPWRFSLQTQGWKKMFFMNPSDNFYI
jgi:peptidoglycan LD-endopeptidase LytH